MPNRFQDTIRVELVASREAPSQDLLALDTSYDPLAAANHLMKSVSELGGALHKGGAKLTVDMRADDPFDYLRDLQGDKEFKLKIRFDRGNGLGETLLELPVTRDNIVRVDDVLKQAADAVSFAASKPQHDQADVELAARNTIKNGGRGGR